MAAIQTTRLGRLDINLIQGDNKAVSLVFRDKDPLGVLTPIDLTDYSVIKMDIKTKVDVNETPFISWTVGNGLTISGDDNNILSFEFSQQFNASQNLEWTYDIKFIKASKVMHLIEGVVRVQRVVTL